MSRENVISRNPITEEQSILCGRRVVLLLEKKIKSREMKIFHAIDKIFTTNREFDYTVKNKDNDIII